jgi:hypothetical protein
MPHGSTFAWGFLSWDALFSEATLVGLAYAFE